MKHKLTLFLTFFVSFSYAQLNPLGSWTDYLPYQSGTSIASNENVIYCGTTTGLFSFDTKDNSISKFSKVNILNDVEVKLIAYSKEFSTLIVVYNNANIDLISNNRVVNVPFIKLSNEEKEINEIKIQGEEAYLSTAYGITVLNLKRKEIVDSYKFGPGGTAINVNSSTLFNNKIYAATNSGVYSASLNNNLLDFNSWSKLSFKSNVLIKSLIAANNGFAIVSNQNTASIDSVHLFNGNTFTLLPLFNDQEFKSVNYLEQSILVVTNKNVFTLDKNLGLTEQVNFNNNNVVGAALSDNGNLFLINTFDPLLQLDRSSGQIKQFIRPNGPFDENIFDLDVEDGNLWAVNGAHNSTYNNGYNYIKIYHYDGSSWENYIEFADTSLRGVYDGLSVNINPNNSNQVFFGTWGFGLLQFNKSSPFSKQNNLNSNLKVREALANSNWTGVGETTFDEEGNLWMANSYTLNGLAVRKKNGSITSFDLSNLYKGEETTVYDIEIDDNGFKWIALPKDNAIVVYDDNGTIDNMTDDRSILLTSEEGKGSIPGIRGIKIEKDKDGLIWIGTSDGIAVHFNPGGVFDGDTDFDRIIFFDGENNEIVLKNSIVSEIAVDGFNRKWIGTQSSGVLLLSEDGKETIHRFNIDNSPLFSNSINAISIDDKTGEVYFATTKGLLSYRGEAIAGSENYNKVSVFPNPVRPEYEGKIAISGLLDNSTVKITDINGTLINELKSQGGQVLWDGNNFSGRRASTGVYLVFMSGEDEDGDLKTEVGKIMFLK